MLVFLFLLLQPVQSIFRMCLVTQEKLQINKTLTGSFCCCCCFFFLCFVFSVGNFRQSIKNTSIKIKTNEFKLLRQYYFFAPDFWFIDNKKMYKKNRELRKEYKNKYVVVGFNLYDLSVHSYFHFPQYMYKNACRRRNYMSWNYHPMIYVMT